MHSSNSPSPQQKLFQYKVTISKVRLSMKFPCRMFLQYNHEGQTHKSKQIKIDPKQKNYFVQEEVQWNNQEDNQDSALQVFIRLLSNKGITFTAGILTLSGKDLPNNTLPFKLTLAKALDPQSFCECQCHCGYNFKQVLDPEASVNNASIMSFKAKSDSINNEDLKVKIKDLQSELEYVKNSYDILKKKNQYSENIKDSRSISRSLQKGVQPIRQSQGHQKQLYRRIQGLETQLLQANTKIQKQSQIISMLQAAQKAAIEQKTDLKVQLRTDQKQLEEKRSKIRQLQGQRLSLMMQAVTNEKQVAFLKERIHESMNKTYNLTLKMLKQFGSEFDSSSVFPKFASLSGSVWPKQSQDFTGKLPAHKILSPENSPWQQCSQTFKEPPGSQIESSAMNDISISNIKSKGKEEVSLLNSQLFIKGSQTVIKHHNNLNLKAVSDFVRTFCAKIQKNISKVYLKASRDLQDLRDKYRGLQQYNSQFQRNQYSLMNHLQDLQGGLESQLAVVAERDQALENANQSIYRLQETVNQNQHVIRQLQAAVEALEEQRDQLKKELHQNNYNFAQKEEQFKLALGNVELSQGQDLSFSPKLKNNRSKKSHTPVNECDHNRQIIAYKEQLKTLQLELSHQRKQSKCLSQALQNAQLQKQKCQFAMRLRERMQMLNESIQVSREDGSEEETKESKQVQEDFMKVLLE